MVLSGAQVRDIAWLARLQIDEADIGQYAAELSRVLELIRQMNEVDTDDVIAMAHPTDAVQRLRADKVTEVDQREKLQALAPLAESGLYLVPRVIE